MDKKNQKKDAEAEPTSLLQKKVKLTKVIIDTTAILNLIKHCQQSKSLLSSGQGSSGSIMGVLQKELGNQNNIFVTGVQPGNLSHYTIDNLTKIDSEGQKLLAEQAKNDIGFYVSSQHGLAFTHKNLVRMIVSYRNFRNSVMIVYDLNKSQFGLNPLKCYRLTDSAIDTLKLNDILNLTDKLHQDQLIASTVDYQDFFEEVEMKIHRSHLLQAFLFDHIQPHMPSFNANLLRLGGNTLYVSGQLYHANEQSQNVLDEMSRMENIHTKQTRQLKKFNKKVQNLKNNGAKIEKEDLEMLDQMKKDNGNHNKMNLILFSKQVDQLYNSLGEFDQCFPTEEAK